MAKTQEIGTNNPCAHCQLCRYWFERCCHALALLEGKDKKSDNCGHFVTEASPPRPLLQAAQC